MTYVCSDLHGYPLEKFMELLEKVNFSQEDQLYILGDIIDRGKDSVKLLKWAMAQKMFSLFSVITRLCFLLVLIFFLTAPTVTQVVLQVQTEVSLQPGFQTQVSLHMRHYLQ